MFHDHEPNLAGCGIQRGYFSYSFVFYRRITCLFCMIPVYIHIAMKCGAPLYNVAVLCSELQSST